MQRPEGQIGEEYIHPEEIHWHRKTDSRICMHGTSDSPCHRQEIEFARRDRERELYLSL